MLLGQMNHSTAGLESVLEGGQVLLLYSIYVIIKLSDFYCDQQETDSTSFDAWNGPMMGYRDSATFNPSA